MHLSCPLGPIVEEHTLHSRSGHRELECHEGARLCEHEGGARRGVCLDAGWSPIQHYEGFMTRYT
jgi:hypothetical protein